eukprot:TRINITY_DN17426_c0_g1_i5.p3 TRINITY_DN17426_c0_g1~~TRINITY_DN17426_c0_g1_i5.p3  ORF type:complete len:243 (-),score=35.13 TRINITY_DN17426_c0_g1_i5:274-936(-)
MADKQTEERILAVVVGGNKPFSVQGVADMVAQYGIKKTPVQKILDELVTKQKIVAKDFGKTRLYIPSQKEVQLLSPEESSQKKAQLEQLNEKKKQQNQSVMALEQELKSWNNQLDLTQIKKQINQIQAQIDVSEKKLKDLVAGNTFVDPQEKQKIEQEYSFYMAQWRKRKGIFRTIWDNVTANMDGKISDLYEQIGIETDENNGADYSQCSQLNSKRRAL